MASTSVHHDCKRNETCVPFKGYQTAPMLERLVNQGREINGGLSQCTGESELNSIAGEDNKPKIGLEPTRDVSFVDYEYHIDTTIVRPTQGRWKKIQESILMIKQKSVLSARHLMSVTGLLAATEKMVPEGRIHVTVFQWHLKEYWRFPQLPDKLLH